ncbi:efflux RND transporter periplasmic adaptor subunit [Aureimonas leprariae]|uniref:Efflux RND transporter periplasmic adaptor subunit n=1 Tax=Plantimonas leprariae TaxID=2615207 RepID=A0A7V7PRM6_9HYPH|nr:efflux RND transporter periplasmic adaptor subunit [Aureimonas leprariae]KAB0681418.1 efflux RND transporter periplasmic adaptor subunit [Aureimonas leprariae]
MHDESPRRRSPRAAVLTVLALFALGGAGYFGWHYYAAAAPEQAAEKQPPKGVPVTVEKAASGDFPILLGSLGTVQALNSVTVRAQVSGQIVRLNFQEGQIVRAGDLLVEIDPRPFQAALAQAEAKLAQDEANLRDARTIFERLDKLAQQQITTRQERDTQGATVNQLTALVAGDKAAIDDAKTQLSYTRIQSPITGRIGFRLADSGNLVGPSDANGIANIQQVSPIVVVFTEPEGELQTIRDALAAGRPAVEALSSDGQRSLAKGELSFVDNAIDQTSGTLRLKATFRNDDGALWPGLSVTTQLLARTVKDGVSVDENAIQQGPDGLFVYVVKPDNKAEMRKVEVAGNQNGRSLVGKGLQAGETVVTEGHYRVQPDTLVEPKAKEGEAKPATEDGPAVSQADNKRDTAEN